MRLTTSRRIPDPPIAPAPIAPAPLAAAPAPVTGVAPAADGAGASELQERISSSLRRRKQVLRVLMAVFVLLPAVMLVARHGPAGRALFLAPAAVAFVILVDRVVLAWYPGAVRRGRWEPVLLVLIVALAGGLFAVGRMNWLTPVPIAAAAVGRLAPGGRAALLRVGGCSALAAGIALAQHRDPANVIVAAAVTALGGLLAHSAERRNILIGRLSETRAELARMAVAEERLRIARDLHDLLGHSLSLITLKAELAGRLLAPDPERAAQEISELEAVARRSLGEVRQAVTGYRQPGLASELAAGRHLLASAGVDCQVGAPAACSFPPAIDALLAWTVREGTTNIARHARARHAAIRIEVTGGEVRAEVTDDGAGPDQAAARPGPLPGRPGGGAAGAAPAAGCGLAGLTERVARLGGTLLAGAGEHGGFRLRVSVPLAAPAGRDPDGPAAARLAAPA